MSLAIGFLPWTLDDWSTRAPRDPVNLFFRNALGDLGAATALVRRILPAGETTLASDQWFEYLAPSPITHRNDVSLGTGRDWLRGGPRLHARLYEPGVPHPVFGQVTAGSIHRDRPALCLPPEAAASFDLPRRLLQVLLEAAKYPVVRATIQPPRGFLQCDGEDVETDGMGLLIG